MPNAASLEVAGFVPLSTVDRPGDLTATVFTQGCPWRCPYCHNPHLQAVHVLPEGRTKERWTWARVMSFLSTRRGLLDGIAFSGGEPTVQPALVEAVCDARDAGFAAYLHTGGPVPDALAAVLPSLAWVGFDVKAPFDEYERVTMVRGSGIRALKSLRLLVASGVPFEARTTVHSAQLDMPALERLADDLAAEGVSAWVLQESRMQGTRPGTPPNTLTLNRLGALRERVPTISIR
ncbi:MAG: anaerobic ribonucleoside-triphosphate reductase activating protein [Coriobacteriia bacterium]|jgi:pyruvate formate lyase activating enzyme